MFEEEYATQEMDMDPTNMAEVEDGEPMENEEGTRAAQDAFASFQFELEGEQGQEIVKEKDTTNVEAGQAGLWGDGSGVITAKVNQNRRFVCVDYPGVVTSIDKAVATMEGLPTISKTLSENGRLAIYFRPGDPYCKPVSTHCVFTQNLLVKIKRRKKKKMTNESVCVPRAEGAPLEPVNEDPYEYQLVVEGVVDRMYSYEEMCDFQYVPVTRIPTDSNTSGLASYKEVLSQLIPDFEADRQEYLSRQMPLFLPPLVFSRRHLPANFRFEDDQFSSKNYKLVDVIETDRKKRFRGTIHLPFDSPSVPLEPHPDAFFCVEKLPQTFRDSGVQVITEMFKLRPIWSKVGLQVNIEPEYRRNLDQLLPMVAFYWTNGAWKNLWCRFGYDPRQKPEAKMYQTIDFRVRKWNRGPIEGKRDLASKGMIKFPDEMQASVTEGDSSDVQFVSNLNATYAAKMASGAGRELVYVYKSGQMPAYRQMRYQVCDIHHPSVQAKLHENDGKEPECTERDGWCIPDFTDMCREILHMEVEKLQTPAAR